MVIPQGDAQIDYMSDIMTKASILPITAARVILTCPGRNFVTLKIETSGGASSGLYGLGDATLNGRELAVASYLTDHVIPTLIGRDAHQIEDIWQFLYRGAYWRRGPVTMTAVAAVDMALWDIKAKAAGMPLYQLLGGACRQGVRVYGHANGETIEETIAEARRYREMGYTAIRLQAGVPGLPSTYGVSRDKLFYEPADGALPTENRWSTSKYLPSVPKLFEAARAALGWEVDLLHDVHHRLTPIEAARLGKDLEPFRLFWLEDAVVAENQANFRLIRQHTTTPHLGLQGAHPGAVDRLHPRHRGARGWDHASAPHCEPCGSAWCEDGLSWSYRSVTRLYGGRAAFRSVHS